MRQIVLWLDFAGLMALQLYQFAVTPVQALRLPHPQCTPTDISMNQYGSCRWRLLRGF